MGLRKKYVNTALLFKRCRKCGEEFPRNEKHFYPIFKQAKTPGWSSLCIPCDNKRGRKFKEANPQRIWESNKKYNETERGFLMGIWGGMKKSKHGNEFESFDEVWEHWQAQKKTYGMNCPILGTPMPMIKGRSRAAGKKVTTPTNVSRDRVLSTRPYSKQNLIFTSWKANNAKNNITPRIARRFLCFVRERYGTEDIE